MSLTKSASPTTVAAFQPVTYTYTVTNTGTTTLANIAVNDDNGTPSDPSDDFTVGTIPSLAPGNSTTLTWTGYPTHELVITDNTQGVMVAGTIAILNVNNGTCTPNVNCNLKFIFNQSLSVNDNSYGSNASSSWGRGGHRLSDLTDSHAAFEFFDGRGNGVLYLTMDYNSPTGGPPSGCPNSDFNSYGSGYGTQGWCAGEGRYFNGDSSKVISEETTLTQNLNQSSAFYGYTNNSPPQGYPGWNFVNGYSVVINPALFGSNGFGSIAFPMVHNSPSINGTDVVCPTPISFMPTTTATATANGGVEATATATLSINSTIPLCNTGGGGEPPPLNLHAPGPGPVNGTVGRPYSAVLTATGGTAPYTFSIVGGSMAPGLTLNPATGAITGTPTRASNYSFTAQVVDSAHHTSTSMCGHQIAPPPPIYVQCPGVNGAEEHPYSASVSATGGVAPYTFSISSGSLPPGLSLNATTGAITGTPTSSGSYSFTVKAVDSDGDSGTVNCGISIAAPPPLNLQCGSCGGSGNNGTAGQPYSSSVTATGGLAPYTFSISSGSLPPGLTLNSSTGAITGTPTAGGNYSFTVKVVDSAGDTATVTCSINVAGPPALHVHCPCGNPGATGTEGQAYSAALTATGGVPPYTFSITSGSLPPGLTLNPATGAITGTPTGQGNYSFTAKVVDSDGTISTVSCGISIAPPPPLNVQCGSCGGQGSTGNVGASYSASVTATGGVPPYTFSITGGSLPPGLTLNSATGAITGTPTAQGNYSFTVKVVDSVGDTATTQCSINIGPPPPLNVTCGSCGGQGSTGNLGSPYSASVTATGGVPPYTFSISSGSLPPGLTLNSATGAITGTPTAQGNYSFTVKVVDSYGDTATAHCSINIGAPVPVHLQCPAINNGSAGQAYSSSLTASGGLAPYTFSITAGTLPPGLTLNASTGAITGTPTTQGYYSFTAKVVDSYGDTATVNCSINIGAPLPLVLTCPSSNSGTAGTPFSSSLTATGGVSPYTFSITSGSLPSGLTLNASTGAISGTPTTQGTYSFTAKVTDSDNNTATVTCSISIAPGVQSLSPNACNPGNLLSVLLAQSGVVAYIPNGTWDISSQTTGVAVVPIEPPGTPSSVATPGIVNSCAANSTTGEVVCTANDTDVYLITGSTLTSTLTSGSTGTGEFSGGNCYNCSVGIESNSNTAFITMGLTGAPSGTGIQLLNLNNNTFAPPFPLVNEVAEDVLWDPTRNLILSPGEDGVYDLIQVQSGGLTEYGNTIGGTLDSAGEDCLTGIALSTDEYTSNLVLTDLTQATYTPGSPGSWTAPLQFQNIPEWTPYIGTESGTDGISVATGTHLGIVIGEYPFPPSQANAVMVIQLPSTSGVGTPVLQDYAVAAMPNDPGGNFFALGCDPHSVTAYVSPVTGKATGLVVDYGATVCNQGGTPQYVALIDLQGMLSAPRLAGTNTVDPTYDLVGNGVVKFVATH